MSTDVYIPMQIVLSHPGQFQFKTALNGDVDSAADEIKQTDIDWDYIESMMKPVLLCRFGARESWRCVEVFDHDLHISCSGQFRDWLTGWLDDHAYKYTHI